MDIFRSNNRAQYLDGNYNSINIEVETKDLFSGEFRGTYSITASTRNNITEQSQDEITKDIDNKITKKKDDESFKWDVYQRARIPEIRLDSKLINENLSFNSTNQQLIIPYRRGASSEGNRNKEEELMITVSNIPDGYTIAKK